LEVKMISTLLAASAGLILGIRITLMALMLICAVCIIVFVMRQHGEEDGLGAISGQTETQDSFYGKNKSKRKESRLKLWTMICGIVIAVLSIAWFVVELLV
jgi:protein translocase SecG subunit